jgi:hypothetical protein
MSEVPVETAAGDVTPAPRRTGIRHFDAIVSTAAIFISAVSLYVAIEHGRTERQLVAANVWPFLQQILSNDYDAGKNKTVAIGFSNAGVGPAKVRSYEVLYRGQPVNSALDLLRKCCGLPGDRTGVKAALPYGLYYATADQTVLRPGEQYPVVMVYKVPSAPQIPDRFRAALSQLSFRVCYCSVLDQCWRSNLQSIRAEPVKQCNAPEHPFLPDGP